MQLDGFVLQLQVMVICEKFADVLDLIVFILDTAMGCYAVIRLPGSLANNHEPTAQGLLSEWQ